MASAGKWEGFSEEDIKFYFATENQANGEKIKVAKHEKKAKNEEIHLLQENSNTDKSNTNSIRNGAIGNTEISNNAANESEAHTLEIFQKRQKLLEEQNRKRKEVLAKVLNERRKQTLEESSRLTSIQDELQKLDVSLSSDINILRDQIEAAAIEFADAQKRYNRAESDYLTAKQTLFSKLERKELLTKHLCTIIEQNEMRKAQKLSELMGKLCVEESSAVAKEAEISTVMKSPYYPSSNNSET